MVGSNRTSSSDTVDEERCVFKTPTRNIPFLQRNIRKASYNNPKRSGTKIAQMNERSQIVGNGSNQLEQSQSGSVLDKAISLNEWTTIRKNRKKKRPRKRPRKQSKKYPKPVLLRRIGDSFVEETEMTEVSETENMKNDREYSRLRREVREASVMSELEYARPVDLNVTPDHRDSSAASEIMGQRRRQRRKESPICRTINFENED